MQVCTKWRQMARFCAKLRNLTAVYGFDKPSSLVEQRSPTDIAIPHKRCSKCRIDKPVDMFYKWKIKGRDPRLSQARM